MKGATSLVGDSLDEVFRLLAKPMDETERVVVQMAKVLQSISQANTQLLKVEIEDLEGMAHFVQSSFSATYPDSRESAFASLAIAFALLMRKWPLGESSLDEPADRVKQEPSPVTAEEGERHDSGHTGTGQLKQEEVPEEDDPFSAFNLLRPLSPSHAAPSREHSPTDDDLFERPAPKSPSTIKRETERMEIMKRRMIESQWEMDRWPFKRRMACKVEDVSGGGNSGRTTNNNNEVPLPSAASILFHCPLSAVGVCTEQFPSKDEAYHHVQMCHPDFALGFSCKECPLAFRYKHELREHNEVRHSPPVPIRSSLYLHKLYFPARVQCPHCPFTSLSSRLLLLHHSADHSSCAQPHLSCTDPICRRRFKFSSVTQVIYHYGAVGSCRGQCSLIK